MSKAVADWSPRTGFKTVFQDFDKIFEEAETIFKVNSREQSYPPYNIVSLGEESTLIELALAGWDKSDLKVTVDDNILAVRGSKSEKDDRVYSHKGISTRNFEVKFHLKSWGLVGAEFDNGILRITLKSELKKAKEVDIMSPGESKQLLTED